MTAEFSELRVFLARTWTTLCLVCFSARNVLVAVIFRLPLPLLSFTPVQSVVFSVFSASQRYSSNQLCECSIFKPNNALYIFLRIMIIVKKNECQFYDVCCVVPLLSACSFTGLPVYSMSLFSYVGLVRWNNSSQQKAALTNFSKKLEMKWFLYTVCKWYQPQSLSPH